MDYLYRLAHTLRGRSGVNMSGYAPLSPVVLESHCRLTYWSLHPEEVEALYTLDAVMSHPEPRAASASAREPAPVVRAWPTKKPADTSGGVA